MAPVDAPAQSAASSRPSIYRYQVVRSYPHDRQAFTQGLVYADGVFYEGTGLEGHSSLRKVDQKTGRVLKQVNLSASHFGEGISVVGDRIVQLTWRSGVGFVYDKKTFRSLRSFSYSHEGWGVTNDGRRLIVSDGTDVLHFLDPVNFRETGRIRVHDGRGAVTGLNELEFVKGEIYANIWPTDLIAVIDAATGRVRGWINLEGILSRADAIGTDVLNGIAYDARHDRFFVTGKLWPKIFEIKITKEH